MATVEEILDRIQNHLKTALKKGIVQLASDGDDGREDSQKSERRITQTLALLFESDSFFSSNKLVFKASTARFWYDFLVSGPNGLWLPVNIKISSFSGSDNLSSKEGLFYTMTGVDPKKVPHPNRSGRNISINSWEPYCEAMSEYFGHNKSADYYFLVIHKGDIGKVFWNSLKSIKNLDPNGNNLPYQASWQKNQERVKRNWEESAVYLMKVFREALVLRARVLDQFDGSIGEKISGISGNDSGD